MTYQPVVAHAAIDAGADLILGHHPHCLKAVEVYKGKVCFYSIGNFMTTGASYRLFKPSNRNRWNLWWYRVDPECMPPKGRYPLPADSRKTMIAKAIFRKGCRKGFFLAGVHQSPGAAGCGAAQRSQVPGDTGIYGVGLRPVSTQVPSGGKRDRGRYLGFGIVDCFVAGNRSI